MNKFSQQTFIKTNNVGLLCYFLNDVKKISGISERQVKNKDDDQLRSQSSSQAEDDDASLSVELDIPVPAPTIPGFIPLPDGPQPSDIKINQPPPNMPMSIPPLGMMPPFGLPNISREYISNKQMFY